MGVISNYRFGSAKHAVSPMLFFSPANGDKFQQLNIKYNPIFATEIKAEIEAAWRKVDPYQPLSLSFSDEDNKSAYAEEERWKSIITYSTFLAIMISCLGLFGLAKW